MVISYTSMIYCPINVKFGMKKQNHTQTQVTLQKYQIEFLFVSDCRPTDLVGALTLDELISDDFLC